MDISTYLKSSVSNINPVRWDDQQVVIGATKFAGVSDPAWSPYKGSRVLEFNKAADNIVYFTMQVTHSYKLGDPIEFHVHAVPKSDQVEGTCKWVLTVSMADINGDYPAESSFSATKTIAANTGDKHLLHEISDDIGSFSNVSGIALCSLMREGTADTYDDNMYLVGVDAHVPLDSLGSRLETTKY